MERLGPLAAPRLEQLPGLPGIATAPGVRNMVGEPPSFNQKCEGRFPEMGVPQNRWFIMENPTKIDDFRKPPNND